MHRSKHASTQEQTSAPPTTVVRLPDPLLTAREAAAERRQALSTFWRDVKEGRIPPAYYVRPRSPRWRRSEIVSAIEVSVSRTRPCGDAAVSP